MSNICELCGSQDELSDFIVNGSDDEASIVLCSTCKVQIESGELDENHFNCLNDSMWSESSAVKVLTFRLLNQLGRQDLVDMMYLEDDERTWAESGLESDDKLVYRDANGVTLASGDTVVITKDLDVKGTGFTAKRGTAVRNIGLVPNDETHIEGRVNGVKIHILTKYLKKSQ
ncbi:MAG: PhnA domain-containing protein [Campylobacterota bacterium]